MNRDLFYLPYPWSQYNKKMVQRIAHPQFVGEFSPHDVLGRGVRLVIAREGSIEDGHVITLYWLVDESDGVIADIRYQMFGPSVLVAALEAACQLLLRKNYDQARRMSGDLIDKQLREKPEIEAFPRPLYGFLNLVLTAIEKGADQCTDIPFDEVPADSPLHPDIVSSGIYPGWEGMDQKERVRLIEEVIQAEIRPYIELDAGGIEIVHFSDDYELKIAYQGSCTSCHSATGSTLSAIQHILQARVHPAIRVTPDLSYLMVESPNNTL